MVLWFVYRLIQECWSEEPFKRPTFGHIIKRLEVIHNQLAQQRSWKVWTVFCLSAFLCAWIYNRLVWTKKKSCKCSLSSNSVMFLWQGLGHSWSLISEIAIWRSHRSRNMYHCWHAYVEFSKRGKFLNYTKKKKIIIIWITENIYLAGHDSLANWWTGQYSKVVICFMSCLV